MVGLILGFIACAMIGAFFGAIFSYPIRKWQVRLIVIVICAFLLGGVATWQAYKETQSATDAWNNGYCQCGGKRRLVDVTRIRNGSTTYYWECDKCYAIFETTRNFT